ncbi:MAG: amino acid--[acyl-carrier-protein] ligase [Gaiellaceae bacterium]
MGASGPAPARSFLEQLIACGLLVPSGVPGVFGRGVIFERIRNAVDAAISTAAVPDGAERMAFPPVMPRRELERIGYLESFPHLAGSIFSFDGDERAAVELGRRASAHGDWSEFQHQTDVVLVPAACYPVYPVIGARGRLGPLGATVDLGGSYVFRHEPSADPARMQMFHQREMVRFGDATSVAAWRDTWSKRALAFAQGLGLDARLEVASDPFFGRTGRVLARSQREQALKFEVSVPIDGSEPTAIASFNYHRDHFSSIYDIQQIDGSRAETACLGFGLERIALALLRAHGLDPTEWPSVVRAELGLGS